MIWRYPYRIRQLNLPRWTAWLVWAILVVGVVPAAQADRFQETIRALAALGTRSTGTAGAAAAAEYIQRQLEQMGHTRIGRHVFRLPVRRDAGSRLHWPERNLTLPIHALAVNAVSPGTISAPGLTGPLVYVGRGNLAELNDRQLQNAIVLMEIDSGRNWIHAADWAPKP